MADVFRLLRWQASWIDRHLGGKEQMMLGAMCVNVALPLHIIGPLLPSGWLQTLIYQMSAFAILVSGLAFVAAGQAVFKVEESE